MKTIVRVFALCVILSLILPPVLLGDDEGGGDVVRQPVPTPCYMMIDEEREVIVAYGTTCDGDGAGCDMTDCPEGSYYKIEDQ